jgi:hypothetical protein
MFAQYIYPQLFMTLWVSMMYSGGLPIIYPLTMINFIGCFWAHKHLLIQFVKRTYEFDESLVNWTLGFFKVAVIFHLFTSLMMFTNHSTLGTTRFEEVSSGGLYDKLVETLGDDTRMLKYALILQTRLWNPVGFLYGSFIVVLFILYLA